MILSSSSKTVNRFPLGRILIIAAGVACILGVLLILNNGERTRQDPSASSPETGLNQTAPSPEKPLPFQRRSSGPVAPGIKRARGQPGWPRR